MFILHIYIVTQNVNIYLHNRYTNKIMNSQSYLVAKVNLPGKALNRMCNSVTHKRDSIMVKTHRDAACKNPPQMTNQGVQ